MRRPRLYFVEPSKVRTYHNTLIEGYLAAIVSSSLITNSREIVLCACKSLVCNLSDSLRRKVSYEEIAVVDQDRHFVVRKSLLEFWVVLRYMLRMERDDVVFISCVMPTALLMIECTNRVLRRTNIFVVVHGEIEALFATQQPHWRTIGYWAIKWYKCRPKKSLIRIVVIDDFIKSTLCVKLPNTFTDHAVLVAHYPSRPINVEILSIPATPAVCFIGHRTPAKGFDDFFRLAIARQNLDFRLIGAGRAENLRSQQSTPISGGEEFLSAIAECSVAVFPYLREYDCSLSAAVLDALSAGVHVVATPRGCFLNLANDLGPDFVTVYRSTTEFNEFFNNLHRIEQLKSCQSERIKTLALSKYGTASVRRDFERICGFSTCAAPQTNSVALPGY